MKRKIKFKCASCGKKWGYARGRFKETGPWCQECIERISNKIREKEKKDKHSTYERILIAKGMLKECENYKKKKETLLAQEYLNT
jgi:DNA-directed RNA polymerase subunit RPC12/RpoP